MFSSTDESIATALRWFARDTAHIFVRLYNICDEASAHLYGEQ